MQKQNQYTTLHIFASINKDHTLPWKWSAI